MGGGGESSRRFGAGGDGHADKAAWRRDDRKFNDIPRRMNGWPPTKRQAACCARKSQYKTDTDATRPFPLSAKDRDERDGERARNEEVNPLLFPPSKHDQTRRSCGSSGVEWHDDEADPAIRVGGLAHEGLERGGEGHGGAVEDDVGEHGVAAAGEELGQETSERRAERLRRAWAMR